MPPLRILLADDEALFLNTTAKLLARQGHRCTCVSNAADALRALREHPYDVALVDLNMPGNLQLELLRDGYANALVGQRPFEMGEKAMDTLLAIKKGEKVPEIVYTGLDLVTKDNVAQMLK